MRFDRWAPTSLLLLLFLLLGLPLIPANAWGGLNLHDAARIGQSAVFLSALLLLPTVRVRGSTTVWPWALLLALATTSCLMSANPVVAWRETVWTGAWLLTLLVLIEVLRNATVRNLTLTSVVTGQFIYALLTSITLLYGLLSEQLASVWHAFPGYENPRFFNHVQTLSLPLLAAYSVWPGAPRTGRRLAAATAVLHVLLLCFFLGRATIVGVTVATVLACLLLRETRLLKAFITYAGVGMLLYAIGFKILPALLDISNAPTLRDPTERGSIEARLYLWRIALEAMQDHPWLGLGPMHFAHTLNVEAAHPHNIYLQVASEFGIPFAVISLGLLVHWLRARWSTLRAVVASSAAQIEIGCFIGICAALIDGLFSGNFVMPLSQSWLALCIGLLMASPLHHHVTASQGTTETQRRWAITAVSMATCAALVLVMASMAQEVTRTEVTLLRDTASSTAHHSPRFWLDGWF
jgi:O-antigen ligase